MDSTISEERFLRKEFKIIIYYCIRAFQKLKLYSGDLVFIHLVVLLCKKGLLKEIIQVRYFLIL